MPDLISHYELIEKIGEGGMGAVYKALDRKLERFVAIKRLPAELSASRADRDRFTREAKAASALNHPNILTIHDLDEHEGGLFIVMEFVEGGDLRRLLASGPLPVAEAVHIASQIAEGLAAAEARGLVHRDIKPGNVLLTASGRVKIADFGLAQFLGAADLTRTVAQAGTPRYMSPEQIEGADLDARSDIFSFGALLYEMLAGRAAFEGASIPAMMNAVLHTDPEPLENVRPETPPALAELVERCLRKEKDARPASFRDIVAALAEPGADPGSPAGPATGSGRHGGPATHKLTNPRSTVPSGMLVGAFAGRRQELDAIRRRIESALEGRGGAILVSGEPGIGKTRLVAEAVSRVAGAGAAPGERTPQPAVYWGRCLHHEGGAPYHPFAAALKPLDEQALREIARTASSRGIALAGRLALLRSFLVLPGGSPELTNKEQLWDAVFLLLSALAAERPSILVLDDLHWADRASIGLFAYVARNAAALPFLLIGTHRPEIAAEEPGAPPLLEAVRQLRIEGAAETLALDRLNDEEEHAALARLFEDDPVDAALESTVRSAARGHPLFLVELVRLLREQGRVRREDGTWRLAGEMKALPVPDRVQDVIAQRLERVPPKDREAMEFASCEGERFGSEVLAAALGLERIAVLRLLQRLETAHGLVRHEGARYRFDHPLIRQVLYDGMLPELRVEYHRMIADDLIANHKEEEPARIAHHLLASGRDAEAVEHLIGAAVRARELHAMEEALAHYSRAADIAAQRRPGIEEGLGDVNASLGRAAQAAAHYERALAALRGQDGGPGKTAILRKLAETRRVLGEIATAERLCREALSSAQSLGRPDETAHAQNTLGLIHFNRGDYRQAIAESQKALDLAGAQNDLALQATSIAQIGQAHMHLGEFREAIPKLEQALSIQREIGDPVGLSMTLNQLGLLYYRSGAPGRALASFEESLRLKRSIGDRRGMPGAVNGIGDTYRDLFDMERAIEHHRRSLALAREQQNRAAECDNLRDLGADEMLLGHAQAALAYLQEVFALSRSIGNTWYETRSRITFAETYLQLGELEQADAFSRSAVEEARKIGAKDLLTEALWARSKVLSKSEGPDAGRPLLEEAIASARSSDHRPLLWRMLLDYSRTAPEHRDAALREAREITQGIVAGITDPELRKRFENAPEVALLSSLPSN